MAGKGKKTSPEQKQDTQRPNIRPDRVERGLEADTTRPLYAAESIHATSENKFAFDSDAPVGGNNPEVRTVIEDADIEERVARGREESERNFSSDSGAAGDAEATDPRLARRAVANMMGEE
jgi:hypothetical protein